MTEPDKDAARQESALAQTLAQTPEVARLNPREGCHWRPRRQALLLPVSNRYWQWRLGPEIGDRTFASGCLVKRVSRSLLLCGRACASLAAVRLSVTVAASCESVPSAAIAKESLRFARGAPAGPKVHTRGAISVCTLDCSIGRCATRRRARCRSRGRSRSQVAVRCAAPELGVRTRTRVTPSRPNWPTKANQTIRRTATCQWQWTRHRGGHHPS